MSGLPPDHPLRVAVAHGTAEDVRVQMSAPGAEDAHLLEAMILAVERGVPDVVDALLAAGIDPNANLGHGETPLHWAVAVLHPELVTLLLQRGADPNARAMDGSPPLHAAVSAMMPWNSREECGPFDHPAHGLILDALLAYGADRRAVDGRGHRPLHPVYAQLLSGDGTDRLITLLTPEDERPRPARLDSMVDPVLLRGVGPDAWQRSRAEAPDDTVRWVPLLQTGARDPSGRLGLDVCGRWVKGTYASDGRTVTWARSAPLAYTLWLVLEWSYAEAVARLRAGLAQVGLPETVADAFPWRTVVDEALARAPGWLQVQTSPWLPHVMAGDVAALATVAADEALPETVREMARRLLPRP